MGPFMQVNLDCTRGSDGILNIPLISIILQLRPAEYMEQLLYQLQGPRSSQEQLNRPKLHYKEEEINAECNSRSMKSLAVHSVSQNCRKA